MPARAQGRGGRRLENSINRLGVDFYWEKLCGGDPKAQQCGWLKGKFGVCWQIVSSALPELLNDPDAGKSQKVMAALLQMKKLDLDELKRVHAS